MVKLEEMVGKGKAEEEPEGEVIVGPSGEAVEQSSGNAPSFLSLFFFSKSHYLLNHAPLLLRGFSFMSGFVSVADGEEKAREVMKEECELGVAHS